MSILLRLKHWQFFGIFIGLPILFLIIGIMSLFLSENMVNTYLLFIIFGLITILLTGSLIRWFYGLGVYLNRKLPNTVKMNLTKFKLSMIFIIIWIVFN
jgi:hypothetical protein